MNAQHTDLLGGQLMQNRADAGLGDKEQVGLAVGLKPDIAVGGLGVVPAERHLHGLAAVQRQGVALFIGVIPVPVGGGGEVRQQRDGMSACGVGAKQCENLLVQLGQQRLFHIHAAGVVGFAAVLLGDNNHAQSGVNGIGQLLAVPGDGVAGNQLPVLAHAQRKAEHNSLLRVVAQVCVLGRGGVQDVLGHADAAVPGHQRAMVELADAEGNQVVGLEDQVGDRIGGLGGAVGGRDGGRIAGAQHHLQQLAALQRVLAQPLGLRGGDNGGAVIVIVAVVVGIHHHQAVLHTVLREVEAGVVVIEIDFFGRVVLEGHHKAVRAVGHVGRIGVSAAHQLEVLADKGVLRGIQQLYADAAVITHQHIAGVVGLVLGIGKGQVLGCGIPVARHGGSAVVGDQQRGHHAGAAHLGCRTDADDKRLSAGQRKAADAGQLVGIQRKQAVILVGSADQAHIVGVGLAVHLIGQLIDVGLALDRNQLHLGVQVLIAVFHLVHQHGVAVGVLADVNAQLRGIIGHQRNAAAEIEELGRGNDVAAVGIQHVGHQEVLLALHCKSDIVLAVIGQVGRIHHDIRNRATGPGHGNGRSVGKAEPHRQGLAVQRVVAAQLQNLQHHGICAALGLDDGVLGSAVGEVNHIVSVPDTGCVNLNHFLPVLAGIHRNHAVRNDNRGVVAEDFLLGHLKLVQRRRRKGLQRLAVERHGQSVSSLGKGQQIAVAQVHGEHTVHQRIVVVAVVILPAVQQEDEGSERAVNDIIGMLHLDHAGLAAVGVGAEQDGGHKVALIPVRDRLGADVGVEAEAEVLNGPAAGFQLPLHGNLLAGNQLGHRKAHDVVVVLVGRPRHLLAVEEPALLGEQQLVLGIGHVGVAAHTGQLDAGQVCVSRVIEHLIPALGNLGGGGVNGVNLVAHRKAVDVVLGGVGVFHLHAVHQHGAALVHREAVLAVGKAAAQGLQVGVAVHLNRLAVAGLDRNLVEIVAVGQRNDQLQHLAVGIVDLHGNGDLVAVMGPGVAVARGVGGPVGGIAEAEERVGTGNPGLAALLLVGLIGAGVTDNHLQRGRARALAELIVAVGGNDPVDVVVGFAVHGQALVAVEGHKQAARLDKGAPVGVDFQGVLAHPVLLAANGQVAVEVEADFLGNHALLVGAGQRFVVVTNRVGQRLGHHGAKRRARGGKQAALRGQLNQLQLALVHAGNIHHVLPVDQRHLVGAQRAVHLHDMAGVEDHGQPVIADRGAGCDPAARQLAEQVGQLVRGEEVERGDALADGGIAGQGHAAAAAGKDHAARAELERVVFVQNGQVLRRLRHTVDRNGQLRAVKAEDGRAQHIVAVQVSDGLGGVVVLAAGRGVGEHHAVAHIGIGFAVGLKAEADVAGLGVHRDAAGHGGGRAVDVDLQAVNAQRQNLAVLQQDPVAREIGVAEQGFARIGHDVHTADGGHVERAVRPAQTGALGGALQRQRVVSELAVRNVQAVAGSIVPAALKIIGGGCCLLAAAQQHGRAVLLAHRPAVGQQHRAAVAQLHTGAVGAARQAHGKGGKAVGAALGLGHRGVDDGAAAHLPRAAEGAGHRHVQGGLVPVRRAEAQQGGALGRVAVGRFFVGGQLMQGQAGDLPLGVGKEEHGQAVLLGGPDPGIAVGAQGQGLRNRHGRAVRIQGHPLSGQQAVIHGGRGQRHIVDHRQRGIVGVAVQQVSRAGDVVLVGLGLQPGGQRLAVLHGGGGAVHRDGGSLGRLGKVGLQCGLLTRDVPVGRVPAHIGSLAAGLAGNDVGGHPGKGLLAGHHVALGNHNKGNRAVGSLDSHARGLVGGGSGDPGAAVGVDQHGLLIQPADQASGNVAGALKRGGGLDIEQGAVGRAADQAPGDRTAAQRNAAADGDARHRCILGAAGQDADLGVRRGIRDGGVGNDKVHHRGALQRGEQADLGQIRIDGQSADGVELPVKHAGKAGDGGKIRAQRNVRRQAEGFGSVAVGIRGNFGRGVQQLRLTGDFHNVCRLRLLGAGVVPGIGGRIAGAGRFGRLVVLAGRKGADRKNQNHQQRDQFSHGAVHRSFSFSDKMEKVYIPRLRSPEGPGLAFRGPAGPGAGGNGRVRPPRPQSAGVRVLTSGIITSGAGAGWGWSGPSYS